LHRDAVDQTVHAAELKASSNMIEANGEFPASYTPPDICAEISGITSVHSCQTVFVDGISAQQTCNASELMPVQFDHGDLLTQSLPSTQEMTTVQAPLSSMTPADEQGCVAASPCVTPASTRSLPGIETFVAVDAPVDAVDDQSTGAASVRQGVILERDRAIAQVKATIAAAANASDRALFALSTINRGSMNTPADASELETSPEIASTTSRVLIPADDDSKHSMTGTPVEDPEADDISPPLETQRAVEFKAEFKWLHDDTSAVQSSTASSRRHVMEHVVQP